MLSTARSRRSRNNFERRRISRIRCGNPLRGAAPRCSLAVHSAARARLLAPPHLRCRWHFVSERRLHGFWVSERRWWLVDGSLMRRCRVDGAFCFAICFASELCSASAADNNCAVTFSSCSFDCVTLISPLLTRRFGGTNSASDSERLSDRLW